MLFIAYVINDLIVAFGVSRVGIVGLIGIWTAGCLGMFMLIITDLAAREFEKTQGDSHS